MAILDEPRVIAHQAHELTLMDAPVFATIGRAPKWGTPAAFHAVHKQPTDAVNTDHFPEGRRTATSAWRGSSYGRDNKFVE
jgi:hypothetical protein